MKINVMGCSQCPTWALDAAYDGIVNIQNQLYNNTNIPGTHVAKYTTNFTANSCDADTERPDANQWLDNNGFGGYELYLFVSNCALATTYGLAWFGRCVGFVGAGQGYYDSPSEMEVMAPHESLHAFLYEGCTQVRNLANNPANHVDHRLGTINGSKKATPMCASYASKSSNTFASTGMCHSSANINWGDWTTNLSACTKEGVQHTYDHVRGLHL